MNCKECNDTRLYQPLIGPSEPCQSCIDTGIKRLVPIDLLQVRFNISSRQLLSIIKDFVATRKLGCDILVDKDYTVTQGYPTILALRKLKTSHPKIYNEIAPDDTVLVSWARDRSDDPLSRSSIAAEAARARKEEPAYLLGGNLLSQIGAEAAAMRQRTATLSTCVSSPPPNDWSIELKDQYLKLQLATKKLKTQAMAVRVLSNVLRRIARSDTNIRD